MIAIARLGDKRQIVITEHTCKARYWNTTVCWGYWASKAPLLCWVRYQAAQLGHADGVSEGRGAPARPPAARHRQCPTQPPPSTDRPLLAAGNETKDLLLSARNGARAPAASPGRLVSPLPPPRNFQHATRVRTIKHPVYFRRKFPSY